jgi:hypothetical protein
MTANFAFVQSLRVECKIDGCEVSFGECERFIPVGGRQPIPNLPPHWNLINGLPICPKHKIKIDDVEFV